MMKKQTTRGSVLDGVWLVPFRQDIQQDPYGLDIRTSQAIFESFHAVEAHSDAQHLLMLTPH
jgi:hypothetical protein